MTTKNMGYGNIQHAQRLAEMYNKYEVPKQVGFLDCSVYELVERNPVIYAGYVSKNILF